MGFLDLTFWGIKNLYWLYALIVLIVGIIGFAIALREKLKEFWLKLRKPEKAVKLIFHFPGNMYKVIWRPIPLDKNIELDGQLYNYDERDLIREKNAQYPEIHFLYNNPCAVNWTEIKDGEIKFSAEQFKKFKDARLFEELLTIEGQKSLLMICLILSGLSLLVGIANFAKLMGWLK